jgi:CheY-like chemotaxis protein
LRIGFLIRRFKFLPKNNLPQGKEFKPLLFGEKSINLIISYYLFVNHKRLLTIDDEEAIQIVVKFGINLAVGWEVLSASDGKTGVATAQRELPDAILLDVMMPEMDGIATFKALQANPITAKIPVIFLTAKAQAAERRQFNDLGISGVITKPFNSLNLPEQIAKILNW